MEKEIDWESLEEKYPLAVSHFKLWVDRYKENVDWKELFNAFNVYDQSGNDYKLEAPKYHDLPMAMQFGIFLEYLLHAKRDVLSIAFSNRAKSIEYYMKRINEKLEREKKNEANSRSSNSELRKEDTNI